MKSNTFEWNNTISVNGSFDGTNHIILVQNNVAIHIFNKEAVMLILEVLKQKCTES